MTDYYYLSEIATPHIVETDPFPYCIIDDRFFSGGNAGGAFGPHSTECRRYMADRCAKSWDGACEYYSDNVDSYYPDPDLQVMEHPLFNEISDDALQGLPEGQKHVLRTINEKYCRFVPSSTASDFFEQVNPVASESPLIENRSGIYDKVCDRLEENMKDPYDETIKKCMNGEYCSTSTMYNICRHARDINYPLQGYLGQICDGLIPQSPKKEMMMVEEKPKEEENQKYIWIGLVIVLVIMAAILIKCASK